MRLKTRLSQPMPRQKVQKPKAATAPATAIVMTGPISSPGLNVTTPDVSSTQAAIDAMVVRTKSPIVVDMSLSFRVIVEFLPVYLLVAVAQTQSRFPRQ